MNEYLGGRGEGVFIKNKKEIGITLWSLARKVQRNKAAKSALLNKLLKL